ncbi:hypothetical protein SAMD00019534_095520 [Acytostelium subglobosum LB1]|uniref:hypothetical protein n=1 Tax=Acytostelium subglobosum LB1 TaxID=1410327 RepID=UPI00064480A3|nr:hypothetical protein SAMD00019534_095520 [Acytostelium subglobosum LB1]GAM26377.1 hypothetical protein SAMD00019534_095520 [Acytostelium subglobosum LB1]|eukprot:XP_012750473.1 hypothetical protein SAMD00019534_095520 [Acytostelium subglobosum LB1]
MGVQLAEQNQQHQQQQHQQQQSSFQQHQQQLQLHQPINNNKDEIELYNFLTDEEETKTIRLICNHLSLGQFELARSLILQIQQRQQKQNVTTSLNITRRLSSILHHTIKNGPPSTWLTSQTVCSSAHLSWLCSIEFYQLNKEGFTQSITERISILLQFAILLYSILNDISSSPDDRSVLPIIQELREYQYILLHQQQQHDNNTGSPNDNIVNDNNSDILHANKLSPNTVAALKKALTSNPQLAQYLITQLSDPFFSLEHRGRTLLRFEYPVASQLELITAEVISHLINQNQYNEAYTLLRVIDTCDNYEIATNIADESPTGDDLDGTKRTTVLTRLIQRVANLNVDSIDFGDADHNDDTTIGNCNLSGDRLTLDKIPFQSKLDNSIVDFKKTTNLSRMRIFESLLSNRTLYPLQEYASFEDEILSTETTEQQYPSDLEPSGVSQTEFPQVFAILRQYESLKQHQPDQHDSLQHKITNDFWYWFYHFLRVNNQHFLEYTLQEAVRLVKERRFDDAMILVKPLAPMLPLVILLCWDHFGDDFSSRQALTQLMATTSGVKVDDSLLHSNQQLAYLVEMAEWCCGKMMAVPNSPGGNRLIVGKHQFDINHSRDLTSSSDSDDSSSNDQQATPLAQNISNVVINQLSHQSFINVIKDCLPFISSKDILALVERDPDYPSNNNPDALPSLALDKLNDMNLIRGFYVMKNILRFFQYRTRESTIDKIEFDEVLDDVFQLLTGISQPNVAIGLVESLYLSIFLSSSDMKQHDQTPISSSTTTFQQDSNDGPSFVYHSQQHSNPFNQPTQLEQETLTTFDNSYLLQLELKQDHTTYYINSNMMLPLISTLSKIIGFISNQYPEATHRDRIQVLESNLVNLKHRTSVANWVMTKLPNISFMRLVLMPVHSLLSICMRTHYPQFDDILRHFQDIPSDIQTDVSQYHSIPILTDKLASLSKQKSSAADVDTVVDSQDLFSTLFDVVIGSRLGDEGLITRVISLANNESSRDLSTARSLIELVQVLHINYLDKSMVQLLTMSVSTGNQVPIDANQLSTLIDRKRLLVLSINNLVQSISNSNNNNNNNPMDNVYNVINNSDYCGGHHQYQLLSTTLKYILNVNRIIMDMSPLDSFAKDNHNNNTKYFDLMTRFTNVSGGPSQILEHIVFVEKNFPKAERMAKFIQVDLATFITSSISHTSPKGPHASLFQSTTPESSAMDSPLYYINTKHPNTRSFSKLPNINNEANFANGHNSSSSSATYLLTSDLVEYLGHSSKLLSCIVCMLQSPEINDIEPFLRYAHEQAQLLPSNSLLNWINEILKAYSFYYQHFQPSSVPEFLPQLEPYESSVKQMPDSATQFNLIQNCESVQQQQTFFFKIIQHFVDNGQLSDAINIADEALEEGAPDWLLRLMVMKDNTQGYKYIRRMKDREKVLGLVMEFNHNWDVATAIDMFVICRSFISAGELTVSSQQLAEITHLLQCLLIYQDILIADKAQRWRSWQEIKDLCRRDPTRLIRSLLDSKHYELARNVRDIFSVANIRNEIEESYLFYLLVEKDDTSLALQTLSSLGVESIGIATIMIPKIRSISLKLFLVQFLLSNMRNALSDSKLQELINQETGYKVLLVLPAEMQKEYEFYVKYPHIILEMLIMNEKIPLASKLLGEIKELRNDEMLSFYARKALSFARYMAKNDLLVVDDYLKTSGDGVVSQQHDKDKETSAKPISRPTIVVGGDYRFTKIGSPTQVKESQSRTQKWLLTGHDSVKDEKTRHNHFFVRSPSISLAKSLFDLCESKKKVYNTCLDLYNYLSTILSSSYSDDNLLIINLIQQLLMYTKLQLLRDPKSGGPTFVAICDTLLGKVELFQSLVISKCTGSMTLADLSDMQKARHLRDMLIQEDRLRLAIDVATKCNIPADPAWVTWGITLIQQGQYNEAREKFKYCLSSAGDRRVMSPSTTLSPDNVDSSVILNQIIQLLETPPTANHINLGALYKHLISTMPTQQQANTKTANTTTTKIDDKFYDLLQPFVNAGNVSPNNNNEKSALLSSSSNSIVKDKLYDSIRIEEAIYYLKKYGNGRMHVNFLMRHGMLEMACQTVLSDNISASVFFDEIVMNAITHGTLPELFVAIKSIDPTLHSFQEHLMSSCKIMNEKKWYSMLLGFQLKMGDNIRAGLTCVKMFLESYDAPYTVRLHHLEEALRHFHDGHTQKGVLPEIEIKKYLQKITTQIEVSKFLYSQKNISGSGVHKLSVFGSTKEKMDLAEVITVHNNFDLGFKISMEYKLPLTTVYTSALSTMARKKNIAKTEEVLNNLRNFIDPSDWDAIAMTIIEILCVELKELKSAEKFIPKLHSPRNSIRVSIMCNKLKSAYLSAVQLQDKDLIVMVMEEAQRTNQLVIYKWCQEVLGGGAQAI